MTRPNVEQLYRTYGHVVLRRARTLLRSKADAEELAQELFASLLEHDVPFEDRASFLSYLYRATTNRCLNRIRDERNRRRILEDDMAPLVDVSSAGADAPALAADLLRKLPEELAQVAVYYFVDEMTQEEIAPLLGCSRRHVGNLVERLLATVRDTKKEVA